MWSLCLDSSSTLSNPVTWAGGGILHQAAADGPPSEALKALAPRPLSWGPRGLPEPHFSQGWGVGTAPQAVPPGFPEVPRSQSREHQAPVWQQQWRGTQARPGAGWGGWTHLPSSAVPSAAVTTAVRRRGQVFPYTYGVSSPAWSTHHTRQLTQCSSGPVRAGLAESRAGLVKALAHVRPPAEPKGARGLHSSGLQVEDALGWPWETRWDASQAGQGGRHPRGLLGRLSPDSWSLPSEQGRSSSEDTLPAAYSHRHWARPTLHGPTRGTSFLLSPPPRGRALREDVPARTWLPAARRATWIPSLGPSSALGRGPWRTGPIWGAPSPAPARSACSQLGSRGPGEQRTTKVLPESSLSESHVNGNDGPHCSSQHGLDTSGG